MTGRFKADLPSMLSEHETIVAALRRLETAARAANRPDYERLAEALALHAKTEEAVLYPASILLGEAVARALAPGQ